MNQPKSFLLFVFASICLVSCNAKPTLQTYFVDHQETPNFISMDVPVSFLGTDDIQMTEIQRQAINSIDKLNMLGYSLKSGNIDVFNAEVGNVKALLKDKRYNELLRLGNQKDGRVKISYIGDDDQIFNNRFDILDNILNENPDTDLFIGKIVRCNLYKNKYINNIQFDNYSGKISFLNKTESHNWIDLN